MRNYVILFSLGLAACGYALFALEGKDCPDAVSVMAKIGIAVSLTGLFYSGFYLNNGSRMSTEK